MNQEDVKTDKNMNLDLQGEKNKHILKVDIHYKD